MLGFSQVLKPTKWQDLLEEGKNGCIAFRTGAKIHFSEKTIFGLVALILIPNFARIMRIAQCSAIFFVSEIF